MRCIWLSFPVATEFYRSTACSLKISDENFQGDISVSWRAILIRHKQTKALVLHCSIVFTGYGLRIHVKMLKNLGIRPETTSCCGVPRPWLRSLCIVRSVPIITVYHVLLWKKTGHRRNDVHGSWVSIIQKYAPFRLNAFVSRCGKNIPLSGQTTVGWRLVVGPYPRIFWILLESTSVQEE